MEKQNKTADKDISSREIRIFQFHHLTFFFSRKFFVQPKKYLAEKETFSENQEIKKTKNNRHDQIV